MWYNRNTAAFLILLEMSPFSFRNFKPSCRLFDITPLADRHIAYNVSLSMSHYCSFLYANFTRLQILLFYFLKFVIIVVIIIKLSIIVITGSNTTYDQVLITRILYLYQLINICHVSSYTDCKVPVTPR